MKLEMAREKTQRSFSMLQNSSQNKYSTVGFGYEDDLAELTAALVYKNEIESIS